MKIDITNWKYYFLGDLFDVVYGVNLELNALTETDKNDPEGIAFVGRTAENNGVTAYVKPVPDVKPQPKNTLTVAGGGSVLSTFLQTRPFYSGRDLYLLLDKEPLSNYSKLFVKTVIELDKYRFNYGRQANKSLPSMKIKLPAQDNGKPDWLFMSNYMKNLKSKPITTNISKSRIPLNTDNWKSFQLGGEHGLFDIKKGKRLTSEDQTDGNTIYIGAIDSNNGVANYIGQAPIHSGNTISLSYNGSVGQAFYQPLPYWATDDVNALYFKSSNNHTFNKYIAMFICTILKREQYRFSYGRKWTLENMNSTVIRLPAKQDGSPDWEWIEDYIKSLPFSDKI